MAVQQWYTIGTVGAQRPRPRVPQSGIGGGIGSYSGGGWANSPWVNYITPPQPPSPVNTPFALIGGETPGAPYPGGTTPPPSQGGGSTPTPTQGGGGGGGGEGDKPKPPTTGKPEDNFGPGAWGEYGKWWKPQGGMVDLGWDPTYYIAPDQSNEEKAQAAHFLNWYNRVLPYLSPADLANISAQVQWALDEVGDSKAYEYFRRVAMNAAKRALWPSSSRMYGDLDRLRELRAASNAYWQAMAGKDKSISEWEDIGRDITGLLDIILGITSEKGDVHNPGIWSQDRPMTRRERQAYAQAVNTALAGMGQNNPFANVLKALLFPTVSQPVLSTPIFAPNWGAQNTYYGNAYRYGLSDPRYVGY